VNEIEEQFDLRAAARAVDKMQLERQAAFKDRQKAFEKAVAALEKKYPEGRIPASERREMEPMEPIDWADLFDIEANAYTIDQVYINFLKETLKEHDWSKGYARSQAGQPPTEYVEPIPYTQTVAIGRLSRAVDGAKPFKKK
jgi:hypothetical protein